MTDSPDVPPTSRFPIPPDLTMGQLATIDSILGHAKQIAADKIFEETGIALPIAFFGIGNLIEPNKPPSEFIGAILIATNMHPNNFKVMLVTCLKDFDNIMQRPTND